MFWNSTKVESLKSAGLGLRETWRARDREGRFCEETWNKVFADPSFVKLDFSSAAAHQRTSEELMAGLYAFARASLDLPFVSSLAAQSAIVPELVSKFASPAQKEILSGVAAGTDIVAICNSEQGSGTNLKNMKSFFDPATGRLTAIKPLATNAWGARFVMVSAWSKTPQPSLEMFLVETTEGQTRNVACELSGFRTGNCGALELRDVKVDSESARLGGAGAGPAIFKNCFDYERLYLAVLVAGVLQGLEDEAFARFADRPDLHDKQYVQEKLLAVTAAKTKILSLVHLVLAQGLGNIHLAQVELGLLKWLCAEEAVNAARGAADVNGWSSFREDDPFNKVARDFAGLRYFGGTAELQKMAMFSWLSKIPGVKNAKSAA